MFDCTYFTELTKSDEFVPANFPISINILFHV